MLCFNITKHRPLVNQSFSQLISKLIFRAASNIRSIISGKCTYVMNFVWSSFIFCLPCVKILRIHSTCVPPAPDWCWYKLVHLALILKYRLFFSGSDRGNKGWKLRGLRRISILLQGSVCGWGYYWAFMKGKLISSVLEEQYASSNKGGLGRLGSSRFSISNKSTQVEIGMSVTSTYVIILQPT